MVASGRKRYGHAYQWKEKLRPRLPVKGKATAVVASGRKNYGHVDVLPFADPSALLQVESICKIHVERELLAGNIRVRTGCGADTDIRAADTAAKLISAFPVVPCVCRAKRFTLTFEDTAVLSELSLFKLPRLVRSCLARPPSVYALRSLWQCRCDLLARIALPSPLWRQPPQGTALIGAPGLPQLQLQPSCG
ncbi:hypothetical protein MRX96_036503 [Rhipicephalus microplus]